MLYTNFTSNLKQEESEESFALWKTHLYHHGSLGEWSEIIKTKEGNICGSGQFWYYISDIQSSFSRGKTLELLVPQLLSVKGLFRFIILLYFTLVSSLALSLRLNEPIYDYINMVTNLKCPSLTFFFPSVYGNVQVYTFGVYDNTSLIYLIMF